MKKKQNESGALRKKAEKKLLGQEGKVKELSALDLKRLVHELGTHQIELEMQNEELRRSQAELETSRSRYADLFDFAPIGYFVFDKDGVILESNLAGANLLGTDKRSLTGKAFSFFMVSDDRKIFTAHIAEVLSKQVLQACEIRVGKKDRSVFHARIQSIAVEDEKGGLTLCRSAISDITERKQLEETLRVSEEKYRSIFEGANDGIISTNLRTGKFLFVNKRMCELMGYSEEEILKLEVKDLHPPESLPLVLMQFNRMAAGEATEAVEIPVLKKDKSIIYCDIGSSFLGGNDKTVLLGFFRDVTTRRMALEAMRKSNQRLEILSDAARLLLTSNTPEKIVETICRKVMDFLDCHVFFNYLLDEEKMKLRLNAYAGVSEKAAKEIEWLCFGETVCDYVARDGRRIVAENIQETLDHRTDLARSIGMKAFACHPLLARGRVIGTLSFGTKSRASFTEDDLALMKTVTNHVAAAMERKKAEEEIRKHREELMMLVEERTKELQKINEELEREITERMEIEAEIVKLNRDLDRRVKERTAELEAVNRELEAYSYTVSHDLRAPLRSIEGFTKAIMEDYADKFDETGRDYLLRVTSASHMMSQFIDALLAMSRLTSVEIKENTVDLSAIAQVASYELKKKQPERRVDFIIAEKLKVKGDINMLRVVIENLFDNAWKFTSRHPSAKIEFGMMNEERSQGPVYFVRDNGAGFNMEFADKLFSPFRRFHKESEFPGIGIGLATAYKIIKRHGGKIWAESEVEKGATFYFTLG
ncbi:MAG: PAS domain S-box protein [Nitrospirae bacterium]|nr:PAS domain S-box protein [Nitrospirota bacterium]